MALTEPVVLMLIDTRRAHFHSAARRKVFVELAAEAGAGKGKVDRLLRSMYVCGDAGVNWKFPICEVMIAIGFVQGRASPCTNRHLEKQLYLSFTSSVSDETARVLGGDESRNSWTFWIPRLRTEHPSVWQARGVDRRMDHLGSRPQHAELIRKSFGVTGRSVTTPGVRDKLNDIEGEAPIDKEAADRNRANTMRAQCLSSPVTDQRYKSSVETWRASCNRHRTWTKLVSKRLARFLGVRPRLIWLFKWQKRVTRIEAWCDTDHAGCIRTRKSVSGCALTLGNSTVSTYCKGQAVIALSSGIAEYCGLVSAASQTLGQQSILLDWGWKFHAHVWMDATAGIATGSRRGRVKHIETVFLWVQTMVWIRYINRVRAS